MIKKSRTTESVVVFTNSQQARARGTLISLNRHMVVFEVYNPYSIVQLSEVLRDLRIRRGERDIYQGNAVVTNLVNTGLMLIVSASLVEPWSDLANLTPGPALREEVQCFADDWCQANAQLIPRYQIAVTNLRNFLLELNRWLEHGEALAGVSEPGVDNDLAREFVADVDAMTYDQLLELYDHFEAAAQEVPRKVASVHRAFAQRELHPVILCAPFMHRTYTKPLGYAGDYEMVNMMLRDPFEGNNTFAKVLNASALRAEAPQAHGNRIHILKEHLISEARRAHQMGRRLRVLNVGCGPAVEVQEFVRESWLSDHVDIELVDFNEETLRHAQSRITALARQHQRQISTEFTLRSVNDLIKDALGTGKVAEADFDLVYCAGLFDYFGDPTCESLLQLFYTWISAGGLVVATNVTPNHSTIGLMSHLLEWNLRLRSGKQMGLLAESLGYNRVTSDATGVNVFLEIRKPT